MKKIFEYLEDTVDLRQEREVLHNMPDIIAILTWWNY